MAIKTQPLPATMQTKRFITALLVLSLLALTISIISKLETAEKTVDLSGTSRGIEERGWEEASNRALVTTANALAGGGKSSAMPNPNAALQETSAANMARLSNSMAEVKARFEEDWKKPIAFYGKVVEQDEQPVEGANVSFVWNDLSPTGTSKTQTTSGAGGLFSLVGMTGRGLSVQVSKPGYYLQKRGGQFDFEYAREYEPSYYRPDPNNPVIFRLRRKGAGTELITSKYGVLPELEFSTPRDGSPVWVDFFGRRVGNRGQMELSAVKPPREDGAQVTGWSFRMTIADGGFIEHNDEFPFEAPEAGYEPTIAFQFEVGASDWTDLIRKQYYVAFGQPRRYGRIQIETRMFWGVRLEYAINPDGSRYLEPKETQYARPQHPPGSVEIVPGRPDLTRTNQ